MRTAVATPDPERGSLRLFRATTTTAAAPTPATWTPRSTTGTITTTWKG